MSRNDLTINWLLFLLWSLIFGDQIADKFSHHRILLATRTVHNNLPPNTWFSTMATSSTNSNPGNCFNTDLMTERVEKCQLSLIAHHLSVKKFDKLDIKGGLLGYLGEGSNFKVERKSNDFFHVYFDDMVLLTKVLSQSPLVVRNCWLRFQLWNPYVESTLDLFCFEDVVVQAHELKPEWHTEGIAKWIGNQIGLYANTLESTETHLGPSI